MHTRHEAEPPPPSAAATTPQPKQLAEPTTKRTRSAAEHSHSQQTLDGAFRVRKARKQLPTTPLKE